MLPYNSYTGIATNCCRQSLACVQHTCQGFASSVKNKLWILLLTYFTICSEKQILSSMARSYKQDLCQFKFCKTQHFVLQMLSMLNRFFPLHLNCFSKYHMIYPMLNLFFTIIFNKSVWQCLQIPLSYQYGLTRILSDICFN